jgi:aryl-alcohol dehydrogenase-like predicted oxidoreductase
MQQRRLGNTDIQITPVAMGCWPIAGMTSIDVNDNDSLATLRAAFDASINFFDTAYCYGPDGESERLIARALGEKRDELVIATKGGVHWNADGTRGQDARPDTLRRECERSLIRLGTDHVDLLYLHAPDPNVPITESAGALRQLLDAGKTRAVGASNLSVEQLTAFHAVCPLAAVQPPYNMLQRQIEADILPWCLRNRVSAVIYWPLMKGLLAGYLPRDHVFPRGDGRAKYPMFQGSQWQRNQDFLDDLRGIAENIGRTVSQVVVNWTIHQTGITAALCGAKRAGQIQETAGAMDWQIDAEHVALIDAALARRGVPIVKNAI